MRAKGVSKYRLIAFKPMKESWRDPIRVPELAIIQVAHQQGAARSCGSDTVTGGCRARSLACAMTGGCGSGWDAVTEQRYRVRVKLTALNVQRLRSLKGTAHHDHQRRYVKTGTPARIQRSRAK